MPDAESEFIRRKAGIGCPMCPDSDGPDVVAELKSGFVHLQNDADYRGYCILKFRRHAVELFELTVQERADFIEDVAAVGAAITEVCAPSKLNVTMLGNLSPHLHCHVMPRYPADPEWGGAPLYRTKTERRKLSDADYDSLRDRLRSALNRGTITATIPI